MRKTAVIIYQESGPETGTQYPGGIRYPFLTLEMPELQKVEVDKDIDESERLF